MHARGVAKFPDPRVRLVMDRDGAMSQRFKALEQRDVPAANQALVEEGVGCGKDCGAVHVMLGLPERVVADAHRTHAAIAASALRPVLSARVAVDPVYRLQRPVAHPGDDAGNERR